jgi:hypothetical protein
MTGLRTWSDEELCQFCIPKEWEDRLESVGCIATPVVSAVVLFLWYLPWRKSASFLEGAAIWVAGTLVLFRVLSETSGWRSRSHKAELARRYGQRAFGVHRTNARHELKKKTASKIYLFQGRDVEGQQYAFVKITLRATEPPSGRLTVRIAPDFQETDFRTLSGGELVDHERELTQEEAIALLTTRAWSAGNRLRGAPRRKSDSEKGYVCSVAALEASTESIATYISVGHDCLRSGSGGSATNSAHVASGGDSDRSPLGVQLGDAGRAKETV